MMALKRYGETVHETFARDRMPGVKTASGRTPLAVGKHVPY